MYSNPLQKVLDELEDCLFHKSIRIRTILLFLSNKKSTKSSHRLLYTLLLVFDEDRLESKNNHLQIAIYAAEDDYWMIFGKKNTGFRRPECSKTDVF